MTNLRKELKSVARPPTDEETARISSAGSVPVFPRPKDFNFLDGVISEYYERSNGKVTVFPLSSSIVSTDPAAVKIDELYGTVEEVEIDGVKSHLDVDCNIQLQPSKQILKRFGIDEQREILFSFQISKLQELGLVEEGNFRGIEIGDLVNFDDTLYELLSVHRQGYFGQTNLAHFVTATADRYIRNNNPLGGDLI